MNISNTSRWLVPLIGSPPMPTQVLWPIPRFVSCQTPSYVRVPDLETTPTRTLVKTEAVTLVRMVVPAGKDIPTHAAKGELIVQCLEGKIAFTACGRTHDLEAGHLLYLPAGEPHSLRGIEDGSLLLTVVSSSK